jgi:hypothetical protein
MIEPRELRIGNYIFDPFDNVVEVAEIKKNEIGLANRSGGTLASFSPIPLTPEILEKAGFEPHGKLNEYYKREGDWTIYTCRWNSLMKAVSSFGIVLLDAKKKDIGCVNFAWKVYYVHQLQNLCFSLNQVELQISL